MSLHLGKLKVNDKGVIIDFKKENRTYRRKLLTMGLTKGSEFEITRVAPLGDPVEIKIKDYNLSLRKEELKNSFSSEDLTFLEFPVKVIFMKNKIRIGLVGNPNCGKTTLFNTITGGNQRIGNWPGVTVDRKSGNYMHDGNEIEIVDLPGIYSLSTTSLDEQIAHDYITNEEPNLLINIIDASNIERNLYLTLQLKEMHIPVVVVLNMMDVVKQNNIKINADELSKKLGCPVVATVANKHEGTHKLKDVINEVLHDHPVLCKDINIKYPKEVETEVDRISVFLRENGLSAKEKYRWVSLTLLDAEPEPGYAGAFQGSESLVNESRSRIEKSLKEDIDIVFADSRYNFIHEICSEAVDKRNVKKFSLSESIDKVVLNRFVGIPIFFGSMYFTFWITINFGGCFIDFFDQFFGAIFVDGFGRLLTSIGAPVFLTTLLADGLGGGVQTVATFIPPIFFMFLCLAVLEDSGYMARAAFVMDRLMRFIGLPGKAFVPMLVGFGCNVPAIMSARTLESERDRKLTIIMNPFMSCGARMPVYALFASVFFPVNGGEIVFALYIIGIILAIATGLMLKSTILKADISTFVMELPPYHIPTIQGVFIHTWNRLKAFILKAGKAILLVVLILSFFNSIGTDGSFGNQDSDKSVLSVTGKTIVPLFKPMGLNNDNWPAAVGIFTGIFAKESVIGSMNSLYSQIDADGREQVYEDSFDIIGGLKDAISTVPQNLRTLDLPFTVSGLIGADLDTVAEDLDVRQESYNSYLSRFDGQAGAFAYLLMVLLYMPCVAAIAAVYRELGLKWTIFCCIYMSVLAWLVSTLFYQVARFHNNPALSIFWITFCVSIIMLFLLELKRRGKQI